MIEDSPCFNLRTIVVLGVDSLIDGEDVRTLHFWLSGDGNIKSLDQKQLTPLRNGDKTVNYIFLILGIAKQVNYNIIIAIHNHVSNTCDIEI
jgi:hypothetical protein